MRVLKDLVPRDADIEAVTREVDARRAAYIKRHRVHGWIQLITTRSLWSGRKWPVERRKKNRIG
jgi:hypothetical protein